MLSTSSSPLKEKVRCAKLCSLPVLSAGCAGPFEASLGVAAGPFAADDADAADDWFTSAATTDAAPAAAVAATTPFQPQHPATVTPVGNGSSGRDSSLPTAGSAGAGVQGVGVSAAPAFSGALPSPHITETVIEPAAGSLAALFGGADDSGGWDAEPADGAPWDGPFGGPPPLGAAPSPGPGTGPVHAAASGFGFDSDTGAMPGYAVHAGAAPAAVTSAPAFPHGQPLGLEVPAGEDDGSSFFSAVAPVADVAPVVAAPVAATQGAAPSAAAAPLAGAPAGADDGSSFFSQRDDLPQGTSSAVGASEATPLSWQQQQQQSQPAWQQAQQQLGDVFGGGDDGSSFFAEPPVAQQGMAPLGAAPFQPASTTVSAQQHFPAIPGYQAQHQPAPYAAFPGAGDGSSFFDQADDQPPPAAHVTEAFGGAVAAGPFAAGDAAPTGPFSNDALPPPAAAAAAAGALAGALPGTAAAAFGAAPPAPAFNAVPAFCAATDGSAFGADDGTDFFSSPHAHQAPPAFAPAPEFDQLGVAPGPFASQAAAAGPFTSDAAGPGPFATQAPGPGPFASQTAASGPFADSSRNAAPLPLPADDGTSFFIEPAQSGECHSVKVGAAACTASRSSV